MNIKPYADTQREKIAEVLTREELPCRLVSTVRGPLTLTWQLLPRTPDITTIKHLLGLGGALQSAMRVESVRIQQKDGLIEIQIPSPRPYTPNAERMLHGSNGLRVAMGLDSMGELVTVDLSRHGAIAWVGPSRRGKTQSMRATLYSAASAIGDKLRYAILAQPAKLSDWQAFDHSRHSLGIASTPKDMIACVQWFAYHAQQGTEGYRLVLVVDDLPSILAVAPIASELGFIASSGAGVGVHLWIGTQMLGSNAGSGGQLVESNVSARIVYKPASNATGARNAGAGGLDTKELSTLPGDAVALIDGHGERVSTAHCNDTIIKRLPQGQRRGWWRAWGGAAAGAGTGAAAGAGGATPVTVGGFTLSNQTMPNQEQRAQLYKEWVRLERKTNATLISVFGYKSGKNLPWLTQAINENKPDNKVINMAERRAG